MKNILVLWITLLVGAVAHGQVKTSKYFEMDSMNCRDVYELVVALNKVDSSFKLLYCSGSYTARAVIEGTNYGMCQTDQVVVVPLEKFETAGFLPMKLINFFVREFGLGIGERQIPNDPMDGTPVLLVPKLCL